MNADAGRRTRFPVLALAGLGALAVLAASFPGSAGATWSAPTPVSGDTEIVSSPDYDAAIDDQGDAVFVWLDTGYLGGVGALRARTRSAAGVLGPVRILATGYGGSLVSDAGSIQVAVDADGDAVLMWLQNLDDEGDTRLRARPLSKTGTLGGPQVISPPGSDALHPNLAITPSGRATFVWQKNLFSDGIYTRTRSVSGTLTNLQRLSAAGEDARTPIVATNAQGDVIFAWKSEVSGEGTRVRARDMPAGDLLGPIEAVSPLIGMADIDSPRVGLDDDGDAIFVWQRVDTARIYARHRVAGGALTGTQAISTPGSFAPQVAVDADGDSVIGWSYDNGSDYVLRGRIRTRLATLRPVETIAAAGATSHELATDAAGNVTFSWSRDRAYARVLSVETEVLGTRKALSPVGEAPGVTRLDVNPTGGATAAFTLPGPFPPDNQLNAVVGP